MLKKLGIGNKLVIWSQSLATKNRLQMCSTEIDSMNRIIWVPWELKWRASRGSTSRYYRKCNSSKTFPTESIPDRRKRNVFFFFFYRQEKRRYFFRFENRYWNGPLIVCWLVRLFVCLFFISCGCCRVLRFDPRTDITFDWDRCRSKVHRAGAFSIDR